MEDISDGTRTFDPFSQKEPEVAGVDTIELQAKKWGAVTIMSSTSLSYFKWPDNVFWLKKKKNY